MRPDPRHYADAIVFWVVVILCVFLTMYLHGEQRYQDGLGEGRKQCAKIAGHDPISTTPDSCTFAKSYGRATIRRKAL